MYFAKFFEISRKVEDLGAGDVTTNSTVNPTTTASAKIIAKQDVRACGAPLWPVALELVGQRGHAFSSQVDGATLRQGQTSLR